MKTGKLFLILSLALLTASTAIVEHAWAASYDGTYDLDYSLYNGSSWQWITLEGGLIVEDGETSSPRAGYFVGYVYSDGSVWMQSPNPLAPSETAIFTGYINNDGTGSGDWQAPNGYGTWVVERVSGPFSGGGGVLGFSEEVANALARSKLEDVSRSGAHALVLVCPFCNVMYEGQQKKIAKEASLSLRVPVVYYPQILGLALGMSSKDLGFKLNRVKASELLRLVEG